MARRSEASATKQPVPAPTDDVVAEDEVIEEDEEDEEEDEEEGAEAGQDQAGDQGYDSESSASGTDSLTWISWFCTLPGHEYFAEVAEDFIEDDFNLTGLVALVPFYKEALEMILDVEPEEESLKIPDVSIVESSAELLYGLIHQRYIVTRQGLAQMHSKYENAHFGYCPRVFCSATRVAPCGRSDLPGVDTVKLFCPSCVDTYTPPSSRFSGVDGAFFGTTFPHLLFQTYKESGAPYVPSDPAGSTGQPASAQHPVADLQAKSRVLAESSPSNAAPAINKVYSPKIYGFRVSERARSGSRMQWLRVRPRTEGELDAVLASSAGSL